MVRKVLNIFVIVGLVIISFPIGAYFLLGTQGFNLDNYEMKFITGGLSMVIVFGTISIFLFRYLKRRNIPIPQNPHF